MQTSRRDLIRVLGASLSGVLLSGPLGRVIAAPPVSYVDQYCYCSDILVAVEAGVVLNVISSGDKHSRWASSLKREVSPGLWVGTSYFTGKDSIHLRFKVDPGTYFVDYMVGDAEQAIEDMSIVNWARVVPGEWLGYSDDTSLVALYQPRRAGQAIETFLHERSLHASEMYRIKALAEHGSIAPATLLPTGEYLATASERVTVAPDKLFDFIANGMVYGTWTWGRAPRTRIDANTFLCKSDFGGPDRMLRLDLDRDRRTVDYHVGETADAMVLTQSARVFAGAEFDYDQNDALVTFTRWRRAGQSDFEWDRDVAGQQVETKLTKAVLERG